jgi:hypothetical protein
LLGILIYIGVFKLIDEQKTNKIKDDIYLHYQLNKNTAFRGFNN